MSQDIGTSAGDQLRLAQSAVEVLYRADRASQSLGIEIIDVAPTPSGERVTATATEITLTARHGIYDVCVTKCSGETVAQFRGRCSRLRPPTPNGVIR